MNIHRKKNGFTFNYSIEEEPSIYINSNKLEKCIKYIQKHKILSITINEGFDFNIDNLNFLNEISFIEKISIEPCNLKDDSALNNLHNLKYLSCNTDKSFRKKIDFLNFKKLEKCNLTFNNKITNLESCFSIKTLSIWKYKKTNLKLISNLISIEKLSISYSSLTDISGIEYLENLKDLTIEYSPKLIDISNLKFIKSKLNALAFRNCKNIRDYDAIGNLIYLERIHFVNAGETKNADFFKNLKHIKYCYSEINILDGNVSALMEMLVMFKNFKHYNHKNNLKLKYVRVEGNYFMRNGERLQKVF